MITIGHSDRFALSFALRPFPDTGGTREVRLSWGDLSIWVAGRNLTAGSLASGASTDCATVPLLPIVQWILRNWDSMFHEERLPRPDHVGSAAEWRCASLQRLPLNEGRLDALLADREGWWERHGLGAALPDFRIPDLHLRRQADAMELSWDDREWRTVPAGVQLVERPGTALLGVAEVADTLLAVCRGMRDALQKVQGLAAEVAALDNDLQALQSPERPLLQAEVATGPSLRRTAARLRALTGITAGSVEDTMRSLLGIGSSGTSNPYLVSLPIPALLLRCTSPSLTDSDLTNIVSLTRDLPAATNPLWEFRSQAPTAGSPAEITAQGYELAMDFREKAGLGLEVALTGEHDIERLLGDLFGVIVRETHLDDPTIDGASVARPGAAPLIAVNRSGRFARSRSGRRMTLAHELCHLLHDFTPTGTVGVVSNPWAPYPMERRANAFAAMLLAPEPAVEILLSRDSETWTVGQLRDAMSVLGVGVYTLTWHLHNLRWISDSERQAWVDELLAQ